MVILRVSRFSREALGLFQTCDQYLINRKSLKVRSLSFSQLRSILTSNKSSNMVSVEDAKKSAAIRAVDNYVQVSNQILNKNLYLVRN